MSKAFARLFHYLTPAGIAVNRKAARSNSAAGQSLQWRPGSRAQRVLAFIAGFRSWPFVWRLAVTVAVVFAAFSIRVAIFPELGTRLVYVMLYPAVAVAAIVGGLYCGLLATVLSTVLTHTLIAPLHGTGDWVGLTTFLVSCLLIVGMSEALHVAQKSDRELRKFVKLTENSSEFIAMCDVNFVPFYINEAGQHMVGLDNIRDYNATPVREFFFPEDQDFIVNEFLPRVLKEGRDEIEIRFRHFTTGEPLWMIFSAFHIPDENGQPIGLATVSRDITERKRAEDELRANKTRLKAIVDTAGDAIVVIDESGTIQSVNPATLRILGYAREDLVGRNVKLLMPEEHAQAHDGYLEAYRRTGVCKIIGVGREVVGQRKDGSTVPLDLSVAEWRDGRGERFFTGTLRDITERKRGEELLARARRLHAVGQLAGGIAHDFNNLLSVIGGNLELVQSRIEDEKVRQAVSKALAAVEAGATFNRRLLSLARKRELQPVRLIVNSRVVEATKLLERTLGGHIALSTNLAPDIWPTRADAGEIDSAILNLAINARDAMPSGGELVIETRNVTLDARVSEIDPEARPGDYVRISISDTGTGMSKEILQRAMEPFFTTKEPGKGTGLGLSSVFGFAKQSGGFVTLSSRLGAGTTVSLYLPRTAEAEPVASDSASGRDTVPTGDGELILVVEDNDEVREVSLKRLEALGYAVLEARTGPEAIERLNVGEPIELVFTDVVMPGGMTGYDLARWVHANKPHVKVVLTSGYNAGERKRDEREPLGNITTLGKPYTSAQLARSMRAALDAGAG